MSQENTSLLVVDDNVTNLDLMSRYMTRYGYDIVTAEKGGRAVEMILEEQQQFDIVLLDLKLPDMSGREVLETLRKKYTLSELPVIMLTAEQESEAMIDALQLGANDYVIKPIDYNILTARVDTQVNLRRTQLAYKSIQQDLERLVKLRTEELARVNNTLITDRTRFKYLLSSSPAITYATSYGDNHHCSFISENVSEVLGYSPEDVTDDPGFWITHLHPDDRDQALNDVNRNIVNGYGQVEYRIRHHDGTYRWVIDQHRVVFKNEKPVEIVGTWTNITEQYKLQEALDYTETHDKLTGLLNYSSFENHLNSVLGDLASVTVQHVVCYMDLDQFKVINNTYGHVAGNELLRQIGGILKKIVSRSDVLAYLGGDEYGILLRHCTLNQANRIFESIQKALFEFRFHWEGKSLVITSSIGVVPFNKHFGSPSNVLSFANAACYAAKEAGRNRIHFYSESDETITQKQSEMKWVERINEALEKDRFYLYYQPIIPLGGEQGKHYELLIRMKDEAGILIPPGAFLPAAEKYNISSKIDRWVIQTTLSWLDAYAEILENDSSWGINLSGQSLADENLQQFVIEEFHRKEIPPEKIYFEVTETSAIANLNNAVQFINALKNHGCKFALDDFGSGMSSFAYLKNLPVDYVKIDGMFVKDMVHDETDSAMVKAINDVAHAMGKITIAEFVENEEIIEKLREMNVDYAQGYGIDKPMPLSEFDVN